MSEKAPKSTGETLGYTLFETSIGFCGLVWSEEGIAGVQLPEVNKKATEARVNARFSRAKEDAPPPFVKRAASRIVKLLDGQRSDLSDIVLDMRAVPPFHQRVYAVARKVAPGTTTSYGVLALRAGSPGAARAVGQAMGKNPFALIVPCHRVLASGGKIGGFSANGGAVTKKRILAIEGAQLPSGDTQLALPLR